MQAAPAQREEHIWEWFVAAAVVGPALIVLLPLFIATVAIVFCLVTVVAIPFVGFLLYGVIVGTWMILRSCKPSPEGQVLLEKLLAYETAHYPHWGNQPTIRQPALGLSIAENGLLQKQIL